MLLEEFSQNFTVELVGTYIFDFLKIITMDDTTFISGMLSLPEIKRLRFRYCGLTYDYKNQRKEMVIAFFVLLKIFLPDVLGYPLYYLRNFSFDPKRRL